LTRGKYILFYVNIVSKQILINAIEASVAKWLMSLTLNHLPLTAVDSNPDRDFQKAIQLAYETPVVLFRCPIVPQKMHGKAPEVCLYQ
jgi:hypothetical protein